MRNVAEKLIVNDITPFSKPIKNLISKKLDNLTKKKYDYWQLITLKRAVNAIRRDFFASISLSAFKKNLHARSVSEKSNRKRLSFTNDYR